MKIRSKALYDYLLQVNALHSTPEAIARAKQDYRKAYKRNWKQLKRPRKELRIDVTMKQFVAIKTKAATLHIPHTTYARNVILASIDAFPFIPIDTLLHLLQLISMAAIATARDNALAATHKQLQQAESIVFDHISKSHEES